MLNIACLWQYWGNDVLNIACGSIGTQCAKYSLPVAVLGMQCAKYGLPVAVLGTQCA